MLHHLFAPEPGIIPGNVNDGLNIRYTGADKIHTERGFMSISNEAVAELIKAGIPDAVIRVDGDGYKYQAEVISPAFAGLSKVKRHQKVYATLSQAISSGELHALTLVTRTPDEPATPSA